jgi:hypothetical protein
VENTSVCVDGESAGVQIGKPVFMGDHVAPASELARTPPPPGYAASVEAILVAWVVRKEGLEPSRCYPQVPELSLPFSEFTQKLHQHGVLSLSA